MEDVFKCPYSHQRMQNPIIILDGPLKGTTIDKDSCPIVMSQYREYETNLPHVDNIDFKKLLSGDKDLQDFYTLEIFENPVVLNTGHSVNQSSYNMLKEANQNNPFTRVPLGETVTNHALQNAINILKQPIPIPKHEPEIKKPEKITTAYNKNNFLNTLFMYKDCATIFIFAFFIPQLIKTTLTQTLPGQDDLIGYGIIGLFCSGYKGVNTYINSNPNKAIPTLS